MYMNVQHIDTPPYAMGYGLTDYGHTSSIAARSPVKSLPGAREITPQAATQATSSDSMDGFLWGRFQG